MSRFSSSCLLILIAFIDAGTLGVNHTIAEYVGNKGAAFYYNSSDLSGSAVGNAKGENSRHNEAGYGGPEFAVCQFIFTINSPFLSRSPIL